MTSEEAFRRGFLDQLEKRGGVHVMGVSGGGGGNYDGPNGEMHRFVQAPMAGMGFKSSGNFQGIKLAPGGYGGFGGFDGGASGGFTAELPGGMVHNYAPSAAMMKAMRAR